MSKISNLYNAGDIKYFRGIHKQKQLAMGRPFVSYPQFRRRLETGMTLRDAIYTPCALYQRRNHKSKTPIQDKIRRTQTLQNENVHVISLDDMIVLEKQKEELVNYFFPSKPKPTLRDRFISLFKRKCQSKSEIMKN